jgi:hypothetical protein
MMMMIRAPSLQFHMWRTALLGARRSHPLLFVHRPSPCPFMARCASSTTTPTGPDALKMPWERVLEGGKEYGTFMASVLTSLIVFGGTVGTVSGSFVIAFRSSIAV